MLSCPPRGLGSPWNCSSKEGGSELGQVFRCLPCLQESGCAVSLTHPARTGELKGVVGSMAYCAERWLGVIASVQGGTVLYSGTKTYDILRLSGEESKHEHLSLVKRPGLFTINRPSPTRQLHCVSLGECHDSVRGRGG